MTQASASAPHEDPFHTTAAQRERRAQQWREDAANDQYVAQTTVLKRATQDFISSATALTTAFTRYPHAGEWLLPRFIDDFVESSVAIVTLAREGVFNVGRRELRYLLEAAVKHVYVDQQLPGEAKLNERLDFLNDTAKVPRSSVGPIYDLTIRMVDPPGDLKAAVKSAFGSLSGYTHLSKRQLDERVARAERGEFSGFESASTLEAFNRVLVQTYDLVLALMFEGVGPSFTGDLFIMVFDDNPRWRFHRTKFVHRVSQHFDYKVERQQRGSSGQV